MVKYDQPAWNHPLQNYFRVFQSTGGINQKKMDQNQQNKHQPSKQRTNDTWRQGDLWIAVDGLVANLTDFATSHPGGVDLLLQHAGAMGGDWMGWMNELI